MTERAVPPAPRPIEASGTWRHEAYGLEFPDRLAGGFSRVAIHSFDAAGYDVGVGYNRVGEGALIRFTVYVYPPRVYVHPPSPSATSLQFQFEKDAILAGHLGITEWWSRSVVFERDDAAIPGSAAEFRYPEKLGEPTTMIVSRLYLFQWEGRCVKYRVSFPANREDVARPAVEALLASAPWGRVVPDPR